MTSQKRRDQYRRRRQRIARHRKGIPRTRQRVVERKTHAPGQSGCSAPSNGNRMELRDALRQFHQKVQSYDSITAVLYRRRQHEVVLHLVTCRPMTAAVSLLAQTWQQELNQRHPIFSWELDVSCTPPEAADQYHYVYWYPF